VILLVELGIVERGPLHSDCSCGFDEDVVDEVDAYWGHCCCCIDSTAVRHMDSTLAFHSHSDRFAEHGPWVDRSMVVFVVDVGVGSAGVDYGKADIQHSELADSGTVVLVDELEQVA
jgi:hypothetical protein